MEKPMHLEDLKPGDEFIWADRETRNYMLTDLSPCHAEKLTLKSVDRERKRYKAKSASGKEINLSYRIHSRVYRVPENLWQCAPMFPMDLECAGCGEEWGAHDGVRCEEEGHKTFQPPFGKVVVEEVDSDWLSVELGL